MVNKSEYDYDAFISYAVEDKSGIVNELVVNLEKAGIKVWYVSDKLSAGRSVSNSIREGLRRSRHGIVVLSSTYFAKEWTRKEFNILWANESKSGDRKIFPVWYNVTLGEVQKFDPYLADLYGLDSSKGLDHVVGELVKTFRNEPENLKGKLLPSYKTFFSMCSRVFIVGIKIKINFSLQYRKDNGGED